MPKPVVVEIKSPSSQILRSNSQEKRKTEEERVSGSMLLLEEETGRPGSIWDMGLATFSNREPTEQG